jgi:hypothetical protein
MTGRPGREFDRRPPGGAPASVPLAGRPPLRAAANDNRLSPAVLIRRLAPAGLLIGLAGLLVWLLAG